MAAVMGFGGALVNLFISKRSAKRLYNIQLIDNTINDHKLRIVYSTIQDIAYTSKIEMPEVWYYESGEFNAFATGASKNSSMIAVSTWLLEAMNDHEIQGVIWHEMTHILNGDMVTSTLLQWSLNTFTIVIARIVWWIIDWAMRGNNERGGGFWYYIIVNILQIVFWTLAGLVLMAHSRQREYKADAGSVDLLGKSDMLSALRRLSTITENPVPSDWFVTSKLSGGSSRAELWSSHPPIEKRIAAVEEL